MLVRLLEFNKEEYPPPFLYHGSPRKLEILQPRLARSLGNKASDSLQAVYASDQRDFAIPFTFTISPEHERVSNCSWSLFFTLTEVKIQIHAGVLDLKRSGYLYRLPSETFTQISDFQWVSRVPVKPLDYEIITPTDYLYWIK